MQPAKLNFSTTYSDCSRLSRIFDPTNYHLHALRNYINLHYTVFKIPMSTLSFPRKLKRVGGYVPGHFCISAMCNNSS